jgi:hypothetical protein
MKDQAKAPSFWLFWDYSHLVDDIPDAELITFEGWENIAGWISTRSIQVPEKIYLEANFATLRQTDFPVNNVSWPIMSHRMVDTLLSIGSFAHRLEPVIMLDDTVPTV